MKQKLLLFLPFFLVCSSLSAQFQWQHTNGPDGGAGGYVFNNDTFAFYVDDYFLYRSNDGRSWEKMPPGGLWSVATYGSTLIGQRVPGYLPNPVQSIKLVVSHNNGETWKDGVMPTDADFYSRMAVCSHGIYSIDGVNSLLFRSQDDGLTWDTLIPPIQNAFQIWIFEERVYVSDYNTIYRTDAAGLGWGQCAPPFVSPGYIRDIQVVGQNIIVSTEKRLWYSHDDGLSWAFHNTPYPQYYLGMTRLGNAIYATNAASDFDVSTDFGETWTTLAGNAPSIGISTNMAAVNNTILVATYDQGVFRWDDQLIRFTEANKGLHSARIEALEAAGDQIWAITGTGLFGFDRGAQFWDTNAVLLPLPGYYKELSANTNGVVCMGENNATYFRLSVNHGQTWDSISMPTNTTGWPGHLRKLKVVDNHIFVWGDGDPFRSDDFGQSWQPLPYEVRDVVKFNQLYFSSYQEQIWSSSDEGATWVSHTTIPGKDIWALYAAGDRLISYVTEYVGNIWRGNIYVSEDGVTWHYAHDGLPDLNFAYDFDTDERGSFFGVGGQYFAYHPSEGFWGSLDTCKTWLPVEKRPYHSVVLEDSTFYIGGFGGGVLASTAPNSFGAIAGGLVYSDDNNNGLRDNNEPVIPNIRVSLDAPMAWSPFYFNQTNVVGEYSLLITPGASDTLRPMIQSNYLESINPPYYLAVNGGNNYDFGIKWKPNIVDLTISGNYLGRPRPGFDITQRVHYANIGTLNQDAFVSVVLDDAVTFLDAIPPPSFVFGDSLVWSIPQLVAIFGDGNIQIRTNVPAATALGTVLTSIGHITSSGTDLTPGDNLVILSDTVVGSYDPNEKRVEPADGLSAEEIAAGKELLYTIQFQNTGTSEAERVRITDGLDTALYWPSLRFVSASHAVHSFQLLPGGLLEVVFEHISLPDSTTNEAGSHGYVTFAIQRNKFFRSNDEILNQAAIYFDYNEPVHTNQVITRLKQESVGVKNTTGKAIPDLTIYPNPAPGFFTVSTDQWLSGPGLLTIQNTSGQICREIRVSDLGQPIPVPSSNLPVGIYFVRLSGNNQSACGRVVIQSGR